MQLQDAIKFITNDSFSTGNKKIWADLGCGTGTFTLALASMLDSGSTIFAIDSDASALSQIPETYNQTEIVKIKADFVNTGLPFDRLDGFLMANSLHFVKDKEAFLKKLKPCLNTDACLLIIEYETNTPNIWVPYPVDFQSLKSLFTKSGYSEISKLNTRTSIYGNRQMYAALIKS
jgi:ubiquinone/menaquinone biosynthesis C-methylase UbiE